MPPWPRPRALLEGPGGHRMGSPPMEIRCVRALGIQTPLRSPSRRSQQPRSRRALTSPRPPQQMLSTKCYQSRRWSPSRGVVLCRARRRSPPRCPRRRARNRFPRGYGPTGPHLEENVTPPLPSGPLTLTDPHSFVQVAATRPARERSKRYWEQRRAIEGAPPAAEAGETPPPPPRRLAFRSPTPERAPDPTEAPQVPSLCQMVPETPATATTPIPVEPPPPARPGLCRRAAAGD